MTLLAQTWLKRTAAEGITQPAVTAALWAAGDLDATVAKDRLRKAVAAGLDLDVTAPALVAAGISLCPLVQAKLSGSARDRGLALATLAHGLDGACVAPVANLAANAAAPRTDRVAALHALAGSDDPAARKAIAQTLAEAATDVRAAAVAASARPAGGRVALYRLTPFLHDPSPEVRAAASAGVVRAAGDAGLEQLYLIFKETDPRPYEATAAELAGLSSGASADLLGRFLRKEEPRVRAAAGLALAGRRDRYAKAVLASLAKRADPRMAPYAVAFVPAAERRALLAATNEALYAALLRAGEWESAGMWLVAHHEAMPIGKRATLLSAWLTARESREPAPKVATTH